MILIYDLFSGSPRVTIGSLVMYTTLLFLCIYAFITRPSIDRNASLYFTLTVAIFGVVNSALLLVLPLSGSTYTLIRLMVAGVAMGMTLSPLIWMTGVSIFSTLTTEKRRVSLILGYIVTFVDFTAIIVSMVFLEKYFSLGDSNKDSTAHNYHVIAYLVATFSTYIYFLLFFVLVIRYRRFVSRKIMVTLIIFGILNGVRLFGETAFMLYATRLLFPGMVYTYFIITDFFSVISLYMSTVFWKGLLYTESVSDLQK